MIFSDEIFRTLFPGTGIRATHQMVKFWDWAWLLSYSHVETDFMFKNPLLSFLSSLGMYVSTRQIRTRLVTHISCISLQGMAGMAGASEVYGNGEPQGVEPQLLSCECLCQQAWNSPELLCSSSSQVSIQGLGVRRID